MGSLSLPQPRSARTELRGVSSRPYVSPRFGGRLGAGVRCGDRVTSSGTSVVGGLGACRRVGVLLGGERWLGGDTGWRTRGCPVPEPSPAHENTNRGAPGRCRKCC